MREQSYEQRVAKRLAQEYAEVDDPIVSGQLQLDRWWQATRDLEAELDDEYEVGGFMERWSQTTSFTKGRRDRDWRVR